MNKLIIGIVLVVLAGIILLVVNYTYFDLQNFFHLKTVSHSGSPRHLSVNIVDKIQNDPSP